MAPFVAYLEKYGINIGSRSYRVTEMVWRSMQAYLQGADRYFLALHCDGRDVMAFFMLPDGVVSVVVALDNGRYPGLSSVLSTAAPYERRIFDLYGAEALWAREESALLDRGCWSSPRPLWAHAARGNMQYRAPDIAAPLSPGLHIEGEHFTYMGDACTTPIGVEGTMQRDKIVSAALRHGFVHRGLYKNCREGRVRDVWKVAGRTAASQSVARQLAFSEAIERICHQEIDENIRCIRHLFLEIERICGHLVRIIQLGKLFDIPMIITSAMALHEMIFHELEKMTPQHSLMDICIPGGVQIAQASQTQSIFLNICAQGKKGVKQLFTRFQNYPYLGDILSSIGRIDNDVVTSLMMDGPIYRAVNMRLCSDKQATTTSYLDRVSAMFEEMLESFLYIENRLSEMELVGDHIGVRECSLRDGEALYMLDGEWGHVGYWVKIADGRVNDLFCMTSQMNASILCQLSLGSHHVDDIPRVLASFGVDAYAFDG